MRAWILALAIALPCAATVARAEDKQDAKALLASGLKLYQQKDYLGALTIFRDAYARFPSAKLLLNIATTLTKLDREAEAADADQRALDGGDADPTKLDDVEKVLADLDKAVGTFVISTTTPGAELQLDGGDEWLAAPVTVRVPPGDVVLHVRAPGFLPATRTLHASAG